MPASHVALTSFGYLHSAPPDADLVLDVRRYLRDPAAASIAGILDMDGRDVRVQDVVLATPGADTTLNELYALVDCFPAAYTAVIAVGCAGGRHRSVALVEILAARLRNAGCAVTVEHRHVHLPRVLNTATH